MGKRSAEIEGIKDCMDLGEGRLQGPRGHRVAGTQRPESFRDPWGGENRDPGMTTAGTQVLEDYRDPGKGGLWGPMEMRTERTQGKEDCRNLGK